MNEQMKELVNAIGVIAETSLLYYRTIVGAGATSEEAVRLTQAYIAALMFGGTGQNLGHPRKKQLSQNRKNGHFWGVF